MQWIFHDESGHDVYLRGFLKNRILIALLFSGLCVTQTAAQVPIDLDRLEDKLSRHVGTKMPGWSHRRGEPITGSTGVLIEIWSFPGRHVKVAIVPRKNPDGGRDALREFVKYERQKEELKGLGDEAYAWGYQLANVVVIRGGFSVYVSASADVFEDPDWRTLSELERSRRESSEVKRLSREFAKHLVDAIDLP